LTAYPIFWIGGFFVKHLWVFPSFNCMETRSVQLCGTMRVQILLLFDFSSGLTFLWLRICGQITV